MGLRNSEPPVENSSVSDQAEERYLKQFKSTDERMRYEATIEARNLAQLSRVMNDLIVLKFGSSGAAFVSTLSYCRIPGNTKFLLNKYSAIDSTKSVNRSYPLIIDARVLDDQMTEGTLRTLAEALKSPRVTDRSRKLLALNPGLIKMLNLFLTAAYVHVDVASLALLKSFKSVKRDDKPMMYSFSVDLTIDPARTSAFELIRNLMSK